MRRERARRTLGGAAPFLFLLGLIAILAQDQAVATTHAWFSGSETDVVYSVALVMGAILVIAVAVEGLDRWWALDEKIQSLDLRLALVRAGIEGTGPPASRDDRTAAPPAAKPGSSGMLVPSEGDTRGTVADLPISVGDLAGSSMLVSRGDGNRPGTDHFPDGAERPLRSLEALRAEEKALSTARDAILDARDAIWPTLTGPLLVGIGFVAIAGAMLPGAGVFLSANFRLNTMLILFLSYTWWVEIGWLVFALASLRRGERRATRPS